MELERSFASEEACRAYLARLRWPEGVQCLRCQQPKVWPTERGAVPLRPLWVPDFRVGWDGLPGYESRLAPVVPGDVVRHESEIGRQRAGSPAGPRAGQLPDCLDVAAEAAHRDGPSRPRPPGRDRGSR